MLSFHNFLPLQIIPDVAISGDIDSDLAKFLCMCLTSIYISNHTRINMTDHVLKCFDGLKLG